MPQEAVSSPISVLEIALLLAWGISLLPPQKLVITIVFDWQLLQNNNNYHLCDKTRQLKAVSPS